MAKRSRGGSNACLFFNLLITGVLLAALVKGHAVWDASIKFYNLLLVLFIVSTVLIFKDVLSQGSSKRKSSSSKGKEKKRKLNSLLPMREVLRSMDPLSAEFPQAVSDKLLELSEAKGVAIYYVNKRHCEMPSISGDVHPAIKGARFAVKDNKLVVIYSGAIGEETIADVSEQKPVFFKSPLLGYIVTIIPVAVGSYPPSERLGICIISCSEGNKRPSISVSSAALYLETAVTLYVSVRLNKSLEYRDKETGIMVYSTFKESLQTELERSERYGQSMTLTTMKIIGFDALTPEEQLQVHRKAGTEIKQILRRFDCLFAGQNPGEYLAVFTEADKEFASCISGRISKLFKKLKTQLKFSAAENLQLQIGSATYPTDAALADGLIELSWEDSSKSDKIQENGVE